MNTRIIERSPVKGVPKNFQISHDINTAFAVLIFDVIRSLIPDNPVMDSAILTIAFLKRK